MEVQVYTVASSCVDDANMDSNQEVAIAESIWKSGEEESKLGFPTNTRSRCSDGRPSFGKSIAIETVWDLKQTTVLRPYLMLLMQDTLIARSVPCLYHNMLFAPFPCMPSPFQKHQCPTMHLVLIAEFPPSLHRHFRAHRLNQAHLPPIHPLLR
jgi:hypothetical protein